MAGDSKIKRQDTENDAPKKKSGDGSSRQALPSLRPKGLTNPYTPSTAADPLPREAPPAPRTRYVFQRCMARGGMGEVWLSKDLRLNRDVAIKLVRAERAGEARVVNAVIHEARLTARVEHPNIVPAHDLGVTEDGRFFYTMKRVHGQSLSHILRGQAKGDPRAIEDYSLNNLLSVLRQVCLAVAYVHSRGVLHRDLKPSNIMIGEYGEVMIIDWGLARLKIKKDGDDGSRKKTELVQGTPAYMAPEQAQYGLPGTDEQSDVYSLGAILYQTLTLRPPYRRKKGESLEAYLKRIVGNMPPAPDKVAPHRDIPSDLIALTLRCMDKNPKNRVKSAKELAHELELHIEGKKAEARRQANAAQRIKLATVAVQRHRDLQRQLLEQTALVQETNANSSAWAPVEQREELYRQEENAERTGREVMEAYGEAVRHFHEALTYIPDQPEARAGLADLYWERFQAADQAGSEADRVHYEALIRHLDEERYAARLRGEGALIVKSRPDGCRVQICELVERNRRFQSTEFRELGDTPVGPVPVAMGSHTLLLEAPGRPELRMPISVGREEQIVVDVSMELDIPRKFSFIPAGRFIYGTHPGERVTIDDCAISTFPVTFQQYLEFINELDGVDRFEAWQRLPRSERIPGHRWQLVDGGYVMTGGDTEIHLEHPVVGISHEDARAYCRWLTECSGRPYRLPMEQEWEKAARGPDGRRYPWGNEFDAAFCLARETREAGAALEPIGSIPEDVSPYGVREMAGTVREWCDGWFSVGVGQRPLRGGSWSDDAEACTATVRRGAYPTWTTDNVGFRVLLDLAAEREESSAG